MTQPSSIGIAELSRRTGLTQQAIRAWESRFGFPSPERTEGGRRRYAEADVERLRRVIAMKESGMRLSSAVARVRGEDDGGQPLSVYAELRRLHPEVEPRVLRRPALVAISHAIEDEAMSRAERPYVFGAFQRAEFYLVASRRWHEIARTASSCLAYADFPEGSGDGDGPVLVPLDAEAPLLREWAVVVVSPSVSVALTAWEVPDQAHLPPSQRRFESVFTFDPAAVRTAARVFLAAADASGEVETTLVRRIDADLAVEPTGSRAVDALVTRTFDYLQRLGP